MNTYVIQASKWLHLPVLLGLKQMRALFATLPAFSLYHTGRVVSKGESELSTEAFLAGYERYLNELQEGREVGTSFDALFSVAMTADRSSIEIGAIDERRELGRAVLPIIQLRAHHISYSKVDGQFRSKTRGGDCFSFGVDFSFPQLYCNPATGQIERTLALSNFSLFQSIQRHLRKTTRALRVSCEGKLQTLPVRIGYEALEWIANHVEMARLGVHCEC